MNLAYPKSRLVWAPEGRALVLGVQAPPGRPKIPNLETYLFLLADRVQALIAGVDEAVVREALALLDSPDADLLAGVEFPEDGGLPKNLGRQLVVREQMIAHLMTAHSLDPKMFPAAAGKNPELLETLSEINLLDWADSASRRA
jgi:hypothetical protein